MTISRTDKRQAGFARMGAMVAFQSPALKTMARQTRGHDYMTWNEFKEHRLGRRTVTYSEALEDWTRTGRRNHRVTTRR